MVDFGWLICKSQICLVDPVAQQRRSSNPFRHSLGKRTLIASGMILQTEILVNLQQTLLVRDAFQ